MMKADETLPNLPITGITADSRKVRPGYLFAAIPGTKTDGARFIPQAIEAGAIAILAAPGTDIDAYRDRVTIVTDSNPRRRLAKMAARLHTPQPDIAVAITGTNGKTSTASFTRQIWSSMGLKAASVGTLGIQGPGYTGGAGLTTPDPSELHRTLQEMAEAGIDHVAMEASSHGLDQYRLDGMRFAAAAFTNLTQDHLDYHGSMEVYRASKLRLFEELLPRGGTAIVSAGAHEFDTLQNIATERDLRLISYGIDHGSIRSAALEPHGGGFSATLDVMGECFDIDFPLPGRFQLENALAALGLVIATGTSAEQAAPRLNQLQGVRGRLEQAAHLSSGARVYVDYAHTPDALATVLKTVRPHVEGRLHVVFGCGGDRDRGKRPLMGTAARDNADAVIVTDDNPRGEPPEVIRSQALEGCPDAREVGDRGEAILAAMRGLERGDVLVVAGKGHETGQIVGCEVLPFDDVERVRECAALIDGGRG